jgi:multicomponent Na+:H+ antiporter subunit E
MDVKKAGFWHGLGLFLGLQAVWLLWSGHYTPLLLALGSVSCLVVTWLAFRLGIAGHEGQPFGLFIRLPGYLLWLALEVVKANLDVTRRVLSPRLRISPTIVLVDAPQKTDLGQAIYANSITMTPGTVSVDIGPGTITVHAISREVAAGVESGVMARRVCRLEGEGA